MKSLVRLSTLSIALKIGRFVLGIGSAALLTRLMPIHDYGRYAYVLSVATLLAIPGEAGMPNLVIRELSRAQTDGDRPRMRGLVTFANLTVLALTCLMAVATALFFWLFGDRLPAGSAILVAAAFPAVLLGSLANTRAAVLRSLGSPIASQLPEQLVRPAALILFALLAWSIAGQTLSSLNAMLAYSLASATAFAYGTVLLLRSWRDEIGSGDAEARTRQWLTALMPFSAIAGLQIALVQVSTVILGFYASPAELAIYRIATLASDLTLFSVFAINALVAPQIAAHHHRGETAALETLIGRVNRINVAFAGAVLLGLVLLGPYALEIGFGPSYRDAYLPMCILAAGHFVGASLGYVSTLANMAGREKLTIVGAAFGFALNMMLSLLLCPRYSAVGAAIAASVTAVAWRLALAVRLHQLIGVRAWAFRWALDRAGWRHLKLL